MASNMSNLAIAGQFTAGVIFAISTYISNLTLMLYVLSSLEIINKEVIQSFHKKIEIL